MFNSYACVQNTGYISQEAAVQLFDEIHDEDDGAQNADVYAEDAQADFPDHVEHEFDGDETGNECDQNACNDRADGIG